MNTGDWAGIPVMLQDFAPHLEPSAYGARYTRLGRIEVSPKGSPRIDLYDLLGVRHGGRDLSLRYAGRRDGSVTTGLPLAGPGSDPVPFWTARRPDMTVVLFSGQSATPREGRLDR